MECLIGCSGRVTKDSIICSLQTPQKAIIADKSQSIRSRLFIDMYLQEGQRRLAVGGSCEMHSQTLRQPIPHTNAKRVAKKKIIDSFFIRRTQNTNVKPLPAPFYKLIPRKNSYINDYPKECPDY